MTVHPISTEPVRFDVPVTGGIIETLVVGNGHRETVFLHGLGGSPELMIDFLELLAETYDLRIYAPWLPNHGRSVNVRTFKQISEVLLEWFEVTGLKSAIWTGHSIGAYMVCYLALVRPDLVKLALPLAPPIGPPYDRRPLNAVKVAPRFAYLAIEDAALCLVAQIHAVWHGHGRRFLKAVGHVVRHPPRPNAMWVIFDSPAIRSELDELLSKNFEIAYLFGGWDPVVRPDYTLPGHVRVVERGLHSFPLAPGALEAIVETMGEFLAPEPDSEPRSVPSRPAQRPPALAPA